MKETYVLKIGGHVLLENNLFQKYAETLRYIINKKNIHLVIGGGKPARYFIEIGRKLSLKESILDHIGILVSQINSFILYQYLSNYKEIYFVKNYDELIHYLSLNKNIICGGLFPSLSTTSIACIISEITNGKLLYATDVEGIFDKDPKKYKDAKLFKEINVSNLISILNKEQEFYAGGYKLFDIHSLQIIKRAKIFVRVFNGKNPENIIRAINNENIGTIIYPD